MSVNRKDRAGKTANKAAPGGAVADKGADIKAGAADTALQVVVKDIAGAGVKWDESNTADLSKVFTVPLRLDISDRIKLGVLASRSSCPPGEYLSGILRKKFIEEAEELMKDKTAKDFCEAVYMHSLSALVNVDGFLRLAFIPAIIA